MRLNNCNCGEKIDCGCTVSFDSFQASSVSVLSVGNLVGGSCTFDAYVIDWYVDGQKTLVSGKGNDPAIQAHHPFTGSAAIPVVGGTWVPKIRYVVIGGERIYNGYRKCDRWCDRLEGLPSINVSSLGCGMRNLPVGNLYDYRLTYNTTQDFALASRTIRFDLPTDLSAINFAFNFTAYDVADQVEIFFKDSQTPLVSWIVGTRNVTNWWQSMPYRRASTAHKVAFRLPNYQAGDYLIIRITPSVLEQNTNTQWILDVKCLNASVVFNCDYFTTAHKTITSFQMVHDEVNCRYVLTTTLQTPAGNWNLASHPFYWMVQYGGYGGLGHSGGTYNNATGTMLSSFSYSKTLPSTVWTITGYSTWESSFGAITLSKSGNVLTFVFADSRDYNLYYNNYQTLLTRPLFTDYSSDPTSVKHYRYIQINHRTAPAGCGDVYTSHSFTFHITSPVVFSNGNTLTITMMNVTNGFPQQEACNSAWTTINNQISSIQSSINQTVPGGVTFCRAIAPIGYSAGYTAISNNPTITLDAGSSISAYSKHTTPCELMPGFCDWPTPNSFWLFTFAYIRITITAARDANNNFIEDPRDNFEVYSRLSVAGCYTNSDQRLLYKKVNGVEVTNNLPAF